MTWAEMENMVSEKVDATFGEAFEFRPMRQLTVNDRVQTDHDRSVRDVTGIFAAPTTDHELDVGRQTRTHVYGGDGMARVILQQPRISFDERQFTTGALPRRLDQFKRAATGMIYSVEDVQPDGQGRMVCVCAQVNRE